MKKEKIVIGVLAFFLMFGLLISGAAAAGVDGGAGTLKDGTVDDVGVTGGWTFAPTEPGISIKLPMATLPGNVTELKDLMEQYAADAVVMAVVIFEELPDSQTFGMDSDDPESLAKRVEQRQDAVIEVIEREILKGAELDVRYRSFKDGGYITIRTEFKNLKEIAEIEGIKSIALLPTYQPMAAKMLSRIAVNEMRLPPRGFFRPEELRCF